MHGLSRLSAWWVALGIDLERGRPGHPQGNGAHERLHRDISLQLESLGAQATLAQEVLARLLSMLNELHAHCSFLLSIAKRYASLTPDR